MMFMLSLYYITEDSCNSKFYNNFNINETQDIQGLAVVCLT